MAFNELTGIERQLVLQYLMDGNVPVTVTEVSLPVQENIDENKKNNNNSVHRIKVASSGVFPVALPADRLTVLEQGIILLKNPPESVKAFDGKKVRVQFYFNKLGLYFETEMKSVKSGLALVIPATISKIEEKKQDSRGAFSAVLYYSNYPQNLSINCGFIEGYRLFSAPKWSDIDEENQKKAKEYLERFVMQFRSEKNSIANGLYLISVVRYLSSSGAEDDEQLEHIEGRNHPPAIIYIDEDMIVFAAKKSNIIIEEGGEYSVVLGFPILRGPIKERVVYIVLRSEKIFTDERGEKCCAICRYTNIKEEDIRYLEDMKA